MTLHEWFEAHPYALALISVAITLCTVPLIICLARKRGVMSLPGGRHVHKRPTPKLGGIAVVLGALLPAAALASFDQTVLAYILAGIPMVVLGVLDDVRGCNWRMKLFFSFLSISILIFWGDIHIETLGNLFGNGEVSLGHLSIPFTYFAVFGVINAVNLIDGLNGLAPGIAAIAFASFALAAFQTGNTLVFALSLLALGAVIGFFRYNYPKAKIFLGDSGSLFIGFSLAVLAILLTQQHRAVDPMFPVVVLAIPIFDTLRVMSFRLARGQHPFRADKTHLHHLMLRSGIPPRRTVKIIWFLSLLLSVLGFFLVRYDSWIMLWVLLIVALVIGVYIRNLKIMRKMRSRRTNGAHSPLERSQEI